MQKFFDGLSQKNNLCVLTGDKTAMASVEKAIRQLYAAEKADGRIPKGHPQREDLEHKQQTYEQDFNATVLNFFDKVLFPIQRGGRPAQLANKPLDMTPNSHHVAGARMSKYREPDFRKLARIEVTARMTSAAQTKK